MNNIKVITTMSQEYWDKVGQYSVVTWPRLIPDGWKLWLHDTPDLPIKIDRSIKETEKCKWIEEAEKVADSYPQPPGYQREWKMFCHKSFAMWESYNLEPTGIMIWCDSDVKWLKSPSMDLIGKCLNGKFCAYLGRDRVDTSKTAKRRYSKLTPETCIVIFDLDHPIAEKFFHRFEEIYKSMELFKLYSWCDAAVFEQVKNEFSEEYFNDITKNNPPAIAPLPISFLNEYFEHWMGWSNKEARDDVSGKKERTKLIKRGVIKNAI